MIEFFVGFITAGLVVLLVAAILFFLNALIVTYPTRTTYIFLALVMGTFVYWAYDSIIMNISNFGSEVMGWFE